jgi:hypothetical protein
MFNECLAQNAADTILSRKAKDLHGVNSMAYVEILQGFGPSG